MLSYDGSLISEEQKRQEFGTILKAIVDPLLQLCTLGANHLGPLEHAIYMVNCLYYIQVTI